MAETFTGNFTQQRPIPDEAINAAERVLRSGRLHRYNVGEGEVSEAAALEREFAAWLGADYCLAVASGGQALAIALRSCGVGTGDAVLTNAFTLAPVPGAIAAVGAKPVFVGTTDALTLDFDHLARQIEETGARTLLVSHMRGHLCDMERLMAECDAAGVQVIEDCAHTMGAAWNGTPSGRFGRAACFSTQTYKHMNSGEGGLLTTDDADVAARSVLLSGSYMLYARHGAAPEASVFDRHSADVPNMSARMDNLRAAILRPQLAALDADCAAWTRLYRAVEAGLRGVAGITLIERPEAERFVGSSFQFLMPRCAPEDIAGFVSRCAARGVELKWFGAEKPAGFTSTYAHWRYAAAPRLKVTDDVLSGLLDMRLPLTFSEADCAVIARIIADEAASTGAATAAE